MFIFELWKGQVEIQKLAGEGWVIELRPQAGPVLMCSECSGVPESHYFNVIFPVFATKSILRTQCWLRGHPH